MSDAEIPETPRSLTPAERARLRPTIDIRALERFLAAAPPKVRPLALALCATAPSTMEIRGALDALGLPTETVDRFAPQPAPRFATPPRHAPTTDATRLEFLPTQHTDFLFRFDDAALLQLWEEVEPQRRGDA
jgi:hypothetical protein